MRALITGATGFLGTSLVQRLLADGVRVRALARASARAKLLMEQGVEVVIGDITDDAALQRALTDVTVVYHLAGRLFMPGVSIAEYRHTHVEGTWALLTRCRERPGIERFVHCSTTGVLGVTGDRPADETAPYRPTNAYEETKLEAELLVRETWRQGFPATIVRPGLVYGPGDLHLLGFFRAIQRGLFRPIGRQPVWLHPLYIDDMTEALVRCSADSRAVGACFHIAGREPVTLDTLAAVIARALGVAPPRGTMPLPVARAVAIASAWLPASLQRVAPLTRSRLDFLTHSRVYDVTKAQGQLGFVASTTLAEGVARTVAWYRQAGYLPAVRGTDRAGHETGQGYRERAFSRTKE